MLRPSRSRAALRPSLLAAAALALSTLAARPARAYPQWQLSTGAARCNQCHYAPAGGGLINGYGRDAVGDELSTFGGDGAFLHGAATLPAWLALGADLRGAFVDQTVQDPGGPTVAVFPMQADVEARVALPAGFSVEAVGGLRGQVRDPSVLVPIQDFQPVSTSELVSREHYVMWQPEAIGPYLRVGRFYAPYGLRMAEHILYINRDLGFDELEETYNVSGGFVYPDAELHLTAFAPDFVRHIGSDEKGFAGYLETRFADDRVALAGQTRLAVDPGVTKFMGGLVAKGYLEPLHTLLLGEVDVVDQIFTALADTARVQIVGAAGFSAFPVKGLMITLLGERNQVDVQVDSAYTAGTLLINWFPYAHVELQLMERVQLPSGGSPANTLFLQAHYFL
ncbi:MAG TPA: hypothetical protein VHO06_13125 [Polyangia bacterium]|nr:hypothetical protein [Polyangia bacterium]